MKRKQVNSLEEGIAQLVQLNGEEQAARELHAMAEMLASYAGVESVSAPRLAQAADRLWPE